MTEPAPVKRRLARKLAVAAVLVAAAGGALALYGIGAPDKAAACAAGPETLAKMKQAAHGELAALVVPSAPRALPTLAFQDGAGVMGGLERLRGKVVLVNLWATWCAPCRKEMPALDRLQTLKGGPDFAVAAISLDLNSTDKPQKFLKEIGVKDLAFFADPSGDVLRALKGVGRATGLPTTLILDRAGCEIGYLPGPAEWASEDALKLIDAATRR